jgi:ABC-type enterochelin transport system permease subunit
LAQTLWVGGLWVLQFVILPAIGQAGLAPLLVQEIAEALTPLLIGLTAVCVAVQAFALLRVQGLASLWREMRGQLLLTVAIMALSHLLVRQYWPEAEYWLRFSYLVMAFCGLMLVLQPVPGKERP